MPGACEILGDLNETSHSVIVFNWHVEIDFSILKSLRPSPVNFLAASYEGVIVSGAENA